jgi:hypothetical protein
MIMDVTRDWKNVRYEQLYESNVDVNEYSRLFTSVDFWNKFSKYEHVLVNQWDSYLFKQIPQKFFEYDYVGGPCGHYYINWHGNLMNVCCMSCTCPRCLNGDHPFKSDNFDTFPNKFILLNGGFSLRKVSTTIDLCKKKPWNGVNRKMCISQFQILRDHRGKKRKSLESRYSNTTIPWGVTKSGWITTWNTFSLCLDKCFHFSTCLHNHSHLEHLCCPHPGRCYILLLSIEHYQSP